MIGRTKVTSAKVKSGSVTIEMLGASGKTESLTIEKLLVATGRGPVTDGLGAEDVGLVLERGFVKVDPLFRSSVPGISAVGDVITMGAGVHPQLAHLSSHEGIVLAEPGSEKRETLASLSRACRDHRIHQFAGQLIIG